EQVSRQALSQWSVHGALDAQLTLQPLPHEKSQVAPPAQVSAQPFVQAVVQAEVHMQPMPAGQPASGEGAASEPQPTSKIRLESAKARVTPREYQVPARAASLRKLTRAPPAPRSAPAGHSPRFRSDDRTAFRTAAGWPSRAHPATR